MARIGIIANPASGKDIRRLVSYATTIDNSEKVNICKRAVLAAEALGVRDVVFMPDTFTIGYSVQYQLEDDKVLNSNIEVLDFLMDGSVKDTEYAAGLMEDMGVGCVIVLGGDGTSRAAAKKLKKTPLLSISTGTNNVYPTMMEGTVAGMAAAAVSRMEDPYSVCIRDKRIEIYVNGEYRDMALIDAVISDDTYVGAKAIWDPKRMKEIIVSRCHPAAIGFSSVPGVQRIVLDSDDFGYAVSVGSPGQKVVAPIAAGVLSPMEISDARQLEFGEPWEYHAQQPAMIALDGEREVKLFAGDTAQFVIQRNGPWRVLPREALAKAASLGMYKRP